MLGIYIAIAATAFWTLIMIVNDVLIRFFTNEFKEADRWRMLFILLSPWTIGVTISSILKDVSTRAALQRQLVIKMDDGHRIIWKSVQDYTVFVLFLQESGVREVINRMKPALYKELLDDLVNQGGLVMNEVGNDFVYEVTDDFVNSLKDGE